MDPLMLDELSKAVAAGKFGGDNVECLTFVEDRNHRGQDQFASKVLFGDVVMVTKNNCQTTQSVVIKVQGFQEPNTDALFYNEWLFYSEIVPFLRKYDSENIIYKYFPKMFYGVATLGDDPTKDILVFENLQKNGFRMTASRSFIDYAHIKLSLDGIAQFHSLFFVGKAKEPESWKKIVSKIRETKWTEEDSRMDSSFGLYRKIFMRGIAPLQKDPNYEDKLDSICKLAAETVLSMRKCVTPVEPLAVVCHGDFCRNNMFYKYNAEGEPTDVKLFDLAAIRYCSPVIDLSFFLFLNSDPETRLIKWKEMLETYVTALKCNLMLKNDNFPSLAVMTKDFQRRGFYGYVHCSFFLPMMLDENLNQADWMNINVEELIEMRLRQGGERATEFVSAIVKHMLDKDFDFNYILNFSLSDYQTE